MKKVLLVWTESNPSTMEKEFLLLNGLEKNGIRTHALGFSHSKSNRLYFENVYAKHALYTFSYGNERHLYQGGNYFEKIYNNLLLVLWFSAKLFNFLRKQPTSIIIIQSTPLEITFPTVIIGRMFGIKVVPNIMEYEPALPLYVAKKSVTTRLSWSLITKYADAYIVISHYLEEKMNRLSNKPLFRLPAILPNHAPEFRSMPSAGNMQIQEIEHGEIPILLYSSSQGFDDLISFCLESLSKLRDRNFHLVITGHYPDEELKRWMAYAENIGLIGKVTFSGFLSEPDLFKLQLRSNALLMPLVDNEQHRARFPQKVLGYMRLGKPVITTKIGEMANYFKDNVTVLMDESVTVSGYSEKIRFLLDNPQHATEIAMKGSQYVESAFNEVTLGKQLAEFLTGLHTQ